jgi:hypothetical protein
MSTTPPAQVGSEVVGDASAPEILHYYAEALRRAKIEIGHFDSGTVTTSGTDVGL